MEESCWWVALVSFAIWWTTIILLSSRALIANLFRFAGDTPGDYTDLKLSNPDISVEDGTLSINNIQKTNEGYYLCEAVNGIGSGLSAVILISVQGISNFPEISHLVAISGEFCTSCSLAVILQPLRNLRSNCETRLPVAGSRLCCNARHKERNRLAFYGTWTTRDWTRRAILVTLFAKRFWLMECCPTWASNEPREPIPHCSPAWPRTPSAATTPALIWSYKVGLQLHVHQLIFLDCLKLLM